MADMTTTIAPPLGKPLPSSANLSLHLRATPRSDASNGDCLLPSEDACLSSEEWDDLCLPISLKERCMCLFPSMSSASWYSVYVNTDMSFCSEMLRRRNDPAILQLLCEGKTMGETIIVPVTHEAGFKMDIAVRELVDPGLPSTIRVAQLTDIVGHDSLLRAAPTSNQGPPLVPVLALDPTQLEKAVWETAQAFEQQGSKIHQKAIIDFFPINKGESWPRKVFYMVVCFQREVLKSGILQGGLTTCTLRYLSNHAFYIPFDKLFAVSLNLTENNQLTWTDQRKMEKEGRIWCPNVVNRFLKWIILQLMEQRTQQLFQELGSLFERNGSLDDLSELDRYEVFCVIIVGFIIIGTSQIKLLQSARAWDKEQGDAEHSQEKEAKARIRTMETDLVDPILCWWKEHFHCAVMPGVEGPDRSDMAERAQKFGQGNGVIEEFTELQREHAKDLVGLHSALNLDDAETDRFQTHNVSRLFLRLSEVVWKH